MEKFDVVSAKASVTYFISLALKKELSWNALALILDGITLSNDQYKAVLKSLLKELEQFQQQLELRDNQTSGAEHPRKILEDPLPGTSVQKPEIETDVNFEDYDIQDLSESEDPTGCFS